MRSFGLNYFAAKAADICEFKRGILLVVYWQDLVKLSVSILTCNTNVFETLPGIHLKLELLRPISSIIF